MGWPFVLLSALSVVNGANILCFFGCPSWSHQKPMLALAQALAQRGHNLTVISPNPLKAPLPNYTNVDISFSYDFWNAGLDSNMYLQTKLGFHEIHIGFAPAVGKLSDFQLGSSAVQHFLKWSTGMKFDLFISEAMTQHAALGLVHHIGYPPHVGITTLTSSLLCDSSMGNPHNPAINPDIFLPYTDQMTFWQRAVSTYVYIFLNYMYTACYMPPQAKLLEKYFGAGLPSVWEFYYNKSLLLISADITTDYPQPMLPNIIHTGPLHIEQPEPLSNSLQEWMDQAEKGVVYFSLGSNMRGESLPLSKRQAFMDAFKQLKGMRVLWKWELEKMPGQPSNVLIQKWMPQQSVLAHPKVRVFITQGGLQSFQEAVHYAVPLVGIPLFADQVYNVQKMVSARIGIKLDFDDITKDTVFQALEAVLHDVRYQENMERQSEISKDKTMAPLDIAVWWVEYVLRHNGAPHLRPATLSLAWYQYLLLDIAAVVLLTVIMTAIVILKVSKVILRKLFGSETLKKC